MPLWSAALGRSKAGASIRLLHYSANSGRCETDIFAPGATITSSGLGGDSNISLQDGTSQATPVVAGIILLMQEYGLRLHGHLPSVDDILRWIKGSGVNIIDGDDEADNVTNTGHSYKRINALGALSAMASDKMADVYSL